MTTLIFQAQRSVLHDHEESSDSGQEYGIIHFEYSEYRDIKKIPIGQIYKQTLFSRLNFLKGYTIKTSEERLSVEKQRKDIYVLSRDDIRSHRSKYKFLHVGLVQVSIIYDSYVSVQTYPVLVSLRDSKHQNFRDSVLVALESDVKQGVMKFNWFPNFSAPLSDLANSNALVVTIDPPQGAQSIYQSLAVSYRVCYKLMKSSNKPKSLFENPVLEVNTEKTNVVVPRSNNQA